MIVHPGNCQHIGARASQQDAFGFSDKDDQAFVAHGGVLAVVADGMGGMASGGEASSLAVNAFLRAYMSKQSDEAIPAALSRALDAANQEVNALSLGLDEENAGTTLVAAVIHGDALFWVSVGDSRLYLWRDNQLTQLNQDHIYANDLDRDAASGAISREDAENHPERRSLTSYLGISPLELIDRNPMPFRLVAGDRLLLCSDGFYAALEEAEIVRFSGRDAQQTAEDMVGLALAKERAGQDNLTIAILACEADPVLAAPVAGKSCGRVVWAAVAGLSIAGIASWYFFIAAN